MKENEKKKVSQKISAAPGVAAVGLMMTGFAGVVHAFEYGSSVSLIASAFSFGLIFYLSYK